MKRVRAAWGGGGIGKYNFVDIPPHLLLDERQGSGGISFVALNIEV